MAEVKYQGKHITDPHLPEIMQRVAEHLGRDVIILGGDRNPEAHQKGGSRTSLHLPEYGGRAVDFRVDRMTNHAAFDNLRAHASELFDHDKTYELVEHGRYTNTDGPHLHIGRYGPDHPKTAQYPSTVLIKVEGLTPDKRGNYEVTPIPLRDLHRQTPAVQGHLNAREAAVPKVPSPAATTRDVPTSTKHLNDIKRDLGERYGGSSAATHSKGQQQSNVQTPSQSKVHEQGKGLNR